MKRDTNETFGLQITAICCCLALLMSLGCGFESAPEKPKIDGPIISSPFEKNVATVEKFSDQVFVGDEFKEKSQLLEKLVEDSISEDWIRIPVEKIFAENPLNKNHWQKRYARYGKNVDAPEESIVLHFLESDDPSRNTISRIELVHLTDSNFGPFQIEKKYVFAQQRNEPEFDFYFLVRPKSMVPSASTVNDIIGERLFYGSVDHGLIFEQYYVVGTSPTVFMMDNGKPKSNLKVDLERLSKLNSGPKEFELFWTNVMQEQLKQVNKLKPIKKGVLISEDSSMYYELLGNRRTFNRSQMRSEFARYVQVCEKFLKKNGNAMFYEMKTNRISIEKIIEIAKHSKE